MPGLLLAELIGQPIDYVVLVGYFAFILGFGSFFGRYSKTTRDFFFSGQRFSWWLIGMSMVATGVGSYSFVKYSAMGFQHGMASSMTYMNDWFFIPFFMFGWLPIIYFSRVRSIPEYFQRRFDTKSRSMAVVIILMWMIGYIGYNLFTLGTVAEKLMGIPLPVAMSVIAVISAIYITAGGQTAVIFTDLIQGFMLLAAGLLVFLLGLNALGMDGGIVDGIHTFWANLTLEERIPFAKFNEPPDFHFVGVFWQDGVANSITFLFISQGLIMRFLAAKSMTEGRKTILFNTVFLLPLSMIVVSNAGWLGNAMAGLGWIDPNIDPKHAFVEVAKRICHPGVFGFVLAALSAALMSTIDTLTNAVAAIFVYDVYQPYLRRRASDRHYLRTARVVSVSASAIGLATGFIFTNFSNIYAAHATFTSAVTPPIVVSVFLGAFWKRYTPAAAFWSMFGGAALIWLSVKYPLMIWPLGTWMHGVDPGGGYFYMRALFGLVVSGAIGVTISFFTKPKPEAEIRGLWIGSLDLARTFFKGGRPDFQIGKKVVAGLKLSSEGTTGPADQQIRMPDAPIDQPPAAYAVVRLSAPDMARMKAREGDLLFVGDARWWLGGLRSLHCRAGTPHDEGNVVLMAQEAFKAGSFLPGRRVKVEKFF